MRLLKWLLIGLFALVIAVLVAGYVTLANYPVSDLKALIEQETESATGRKLVIAGDVSLDISLSPVIVLEDVSLANASWAAKQPMLHVERLELELALLPLLSDELAVERLALVKPVVALERDASGTGNWEIAGSDGAVADTLPSFKEVDLTDATITYRAAPGAAERKIVLQSLDVASAGLDDPLSGSLTGTLDGDAFDFAFGLGSMRQIATQARFPFSLQGSLAGAQLSLEGERSTEALSMTLSVNGKDLAQVSSLAGVALPKVGPFSAKMTLAGKGATVDVSALDLSLADSDLKGKVKLDLGADKPKLSGSLHSDALRPDQLTVGPWGGQVKDANALIPDFPLPTAFLTLADADLEISVARLQLDDGSLITKLKTKVALKDGRLRLSPLDFDYGGGRFAGDLTIDAAKTPSQVATTMSAQGLPYGKLLGLPLDGTLDMTAELKGAGESLRAVVGSMKGRSRAYSSNTVVHQEVLALIDGSILKILQPLFGGSDSLKLACAVSDVSWQGGVGRSQATTVAGQSFISTASGDIDLLKEHMDLYVNTAGRGVSLSALVIPFRVVGPISRPSVVPDPTGSVLAAARATGMVLLPPLLVADLLSIELQEVEDPKKACLASVKTIEAGGGTEAFVARWAGKTGEAAKALLEGAAQTAGSAGGVVAEGVDAVGSAVGQGLEGAAEGVQQGLEGAAQGVRSLFGN